MKNKILYGIVGAVVVAALAIGGVMYYNSTNDYVAKVGGEKISKAEFNFFLGAIKNDMQQTVEQSGGDVKAFWDSKIDGKDAKEVAKTKALTEAQRFKIQLIKAKEQKLTLDKAEADNIENSLNEQVKSMGRVEVDKQLKEGYNITLEQYKSIIKDLNLVYKYSSEEQKKIEPSEEDYKKAYEGVEGADKVTVRHILLLTKDAEGKALEGDKLEEVKKKAEEIQAKVKAGEDFKTLASQYSEDPGSKDNAGQYTLQKGQMVKEFEDWAFKAKPSDVGIVKTDYGYHIMKKPTYEELKETLKGDIVYNKYISTVDDMKKDPKYDVIKNQKVYDAMQVL